MAGVPLAVVTFGFAYGFVLFLHNSFFVADGENITDEQAKYKAGPKTSNDIESNEGGDIEQVSVVHSLLFPEMARA